jgi:hypothetical protein
MPREWNTPIREPWNPVIKKCLDGVDEHVKAYIKTGDDWHLITSRSVKKLCKNFENMDS